MSLRKPSKEQPESFEFNTASLEAAKLIVAKYPNENKSKVLLWLYFILRKNKIIIGYH